LEAQAFNEASLDAARNIQTLVNAKIKKVRHDAYFNIFKIRHPVDEFITEVPLTYDLNEEEEFESYEYYVHVLLCPEYVTATDVAANECTGCLLKTMATTKEKRVKRVEYDKTTLLHGANVSRVYVHLLDVPVFHAQREDHRETEFEMNAEVLKHSMIKFDSGFHQIRL
jgi:hypothetical protein